MLGDAGGQVGDHHGEVRGRDVVRVVRRDRLGDGQLQTSDRDEVPATELYERFALRFLSFSPPTKKYLPRVARFGGTLFLMAAEFNSSRETIANSGWLELLGAELGAPSEITRRQSLDGDRRRVIDGFPPLAPRGPP